MTSIDRNRFAKALIAMAEVYGRTYSEAVTRIWWEALRRFNVDQVEKGIARHIADPNAGQFPPKPADIIRMIEGTSLDGAETAWARVERAVRLVGPYRSVCFDDSITMRVLQDMGGWIALCGRGQKDWPFVANEFRTRWTGLHARQEYPDHPSHLPGIAEAGNVSRFGTAHTDVLLIGDPTRAQAVHGTGLEAPPPVGVSLRDVIGQAVKRIGPPLP